MYSNYNMWKHNHTFPIYIFSNDPYFRIYTSWVWKPSRGYFGFFAFSQ